MKFSKWHLIFSLFLMLMVSACGSSGGGGGGSGILAVSITDAKPMLPEGVTNLFVTFEEVFVHKPEAGWIRLELVERPYTIDLLQFQDGNATELVPPTKIDSGKYTQVRLVVSSATIRFNKGLNTEDRTVEVPSENLKTDKNFIFDVIEDSAVDIIVHFDLSMSIVVSGPALDPLYKLKPVLHLFDHPLEAATIKGSISNSSFGASEKSTVIVTAESNQEEYTRVEIPKSTTTDPTEFSIFWIVPNQSYTVEIDLNQDSTVDCDEFVENLDLPEASEFELNEGSQIESGGGICG